jgi:hypothetical protein
MKAILTATMMLTAVFLVGCSELTNAPKKESRAGSQRPKTVVVNEGMSKEEEENLDQRLADLEDKVNDQSPEEEQPTQGTERPHTRWIRRLFQLGYAPDAGMVAWVKGHR